MNFNFASEYLKMHINCYDTDQRRVKIQTFLVEMDAKGFIIAKGFLFISTFFVDSCDLMDNDYHENGQLVLQLISVFEGLTSLVCSREYS